MSLDAFIAELRAHAVGNPPELERLEDCIRVLQLDDSPHGIADYDHLIRAARQPGSLVERLQLLADLMAGRRQ